MDPMDRDRQEQAFSDGAGGEEDGQRTPARETYRDGSLITECWSGGISSGETEKP